MQLPLSLWERARVRVRIINFSLTFILSPKGERKIKKLILLYVFFILGILLPNLGDS